MTLLRFELIKHLNFRKIFILMAIIVGISAFFLLRNFFFQTLIHNEETSEIESYLQSAYQAISLHRESLKIDPENNQQRELFEMSRTLKDQVFLLRSAHQQGEWRLKLESENQLFQLVKDYKKAGGDFTISDEKLTESIAMNQHLLTMDIPPQHDTYSLATPNFIKEVIDWYLIIGVPLIMILFVGRIITNEYENNSIRLLFTQPFRRLYLHFAKGIVSLLIFFITIVSVLLSSFSVSKWFGESGTFQYPVLVHIKQEISFITIKEYLLLSLFLLFIVVLLCITYYFLLSLLFKNTLGVIIIFFITIFLGGIINDWLIRKGITWLNPFLNLQVNDLIVNQSVYLWYEGIPVAITLSFVLIIISIVLLNPRRMSITN